MTQFTTSRTDAVLLLILLLSTTARSKPCLLLRGQSECFLWEMMLIPHEAPGDEVYNLVAREARVYHTSIARPS